MQYKAHLLANRRPHLPQSIW